MLSDISYGAPAAAGIAEGEFQLLLICSQSERENKSKDGTVWRRTAKNAVVVVGVAHIRINHRGKVNEVAENQTLQGGNTFRPTVT